MKLALGRRTRWLGQLAYLEGEIMSISHTAHKLLVKGLKFKCSSGNNRVDYTRIRNKVFFEGRDQKASDITTPHRP